MIQTQKSLFIQIAIVGAIALAGVAALLFLVVRRTLDPIKVVVDASEKISAVEQLSATIIECTHDIQNIAGNAQTAKDLSTKTGEGVMECNTYMKDLTGAMEEITRTAAIR